MKILIAEKINGAWQKAAVLSVGARTGGYNLPASIQGTLAAQAAKAGVNQFRAESAAREVFCSFLGGRFEFRVTRFA